MIGIVRRLRSTRHLPAVLQFTYNRGVSRASGLYRLQSIDLEMDRLRERFAQILAILEDNSIVQLRQDELQAKGTQLRSATTDAKDAEYTVQAQQDKIQSTEQALYGGSVQNPKELQDLQAESESLNRHLVTLEDRQLEAMLIQEELESEYDALSADLEQLLTRQAEEHEALTKERDQIEIKLGTLEAEREVAAGSVPVDDLEHYEKLRGKHSGLAVASLQEGTCSACGIAVAASMQQVIRSGNELAVCPQCNRVLYSG